MENKSIFSKLLTELQQNKNHNASIERCKQIIKELEQKLDKRIIAYFASEVGADSSSMINDEDVFIIENLLSIKSDKKDLVLIMHSNGGYALSAERIIEVCKDYCNRRNDGSKFIVIIPKKAKSAATIVALAADKVYLRNTAELGPVDPQFMVVGENGNIQIEPAYLYIDALENIFNTEDGAFWKKYFHKNNDKPLSQLPKEIKLKLLEQCNYPMYVTAKKELGLSDSIIDKISKEKIKQFPNISPSDFNIFKDPHITKSHGRIINLSDLRNNNLRREKIINKLEDFFDNRENYGIFDVLLFELYVRKKQLINDLGNSTVKTIEEKEEFFIYPGPKMGQIKNPPKQEEELKSQENKTKITMSQ
ncbi:MAG: hypothetical protein WA063_06825 [Minisyncoccia bacterium]